MNSLGKVIDVSAAAIVVPASHALLGLDRLDISV
jgi:hypothetical protein